MASGLADEVEGFTSEFILGLAGSGRVDPLAGTSGIVGGNCDRRLPWSPPLDGGAGTESGRVGWGWVGSGSGMGETTNVGAGGGDTVDLSRASDIWPYEY